MQLFSSFEEKLCFMVTQAFFFLFCCQCASFPLSVQRHVTSRERMAAHVYVQMSARAVLAHAQQANMAANQKGEETFDISF